MLGSARSMLFACAVAACGDDASELAQDAQVPEAVRDAAVDAARDAHTEPSDTGVHADASVPRDASIRRDAGSDVIDSARECDLECTFPQLCLLQPVQCIQAPCPEQPTCVDALTSCDKCAASDVCLRHQCPDKCIPQFICDPN